MNAERETGSGVQIIALGSDHAGFNLKNHLVGWLKARGYAVEDAGTFSDASVDYSDYGLAVAHAVAEGRADCGILVCYSGIGMSIAANKVRGIRAALCRDSESARLSRFHNDANVLVIGAGFTGAGDAEEMAKVWLSTPFEGGRHARRLGKISEFEDEGFWTYHGRTVAGIDPRVRELMERERERLEESLVLVASESIVHPAILEATGSLFTLKYAEGYPGERLYPGCSVVDEIEELAIDRARQVFGADHANVQPYSGTQANMAAYFAVLKPGDKILGMSFEQGGHPTHGAPSTFSGLLYRGLTYGVKKGTELIDYEAIEELAMKEKPALIIAGGSAYSRLIDFPRFRSIADSCGALLMADMAHLSGLVAAGVHPSPVPFADVITSTTHKTLQGPRGGLVLSKREHGKAVDEGVFPMTQGGPLMHVIAAKAICFALALRQEFRDFHVQVVRNARALSSELESLGYRIVTGGTDTHLFVVDLAGADVDGSVAWKRLEAAGILVNKCAIPYETKYKFAGIRIGTLSLTGRGMREVDMPEVASLIDACIRKGGDAGALSSTAGGVRALCSRFRVYGE